MPTIRWTFSLDFWKNRLQISLDCFQVLLIQWVIDAFVSLLTIDWIGLREILQETHGFLPLRSWGFPVKNFPQQANPLTIGGVDYGYYGGLLGVDFSADSLQNHAPNHVHPRATSPSHISGQVIHRDAMLPENKGRCWTVRRSTRPKI